MHAMSEELFLGLCQLLTAAGQARRILLTLSLLKGKSAKLSRVDHLWSIRKVTVLCL